MSRPSRFVLRNTAWVLAGLFCGSVFAQACPRVDPEEQRAREAACRAAGGQWARYGVRDSLCNVYRCAPRTADGGRACRNRADCEFACLAVKEGPIGAEVPARCAAVVTSFGCATHVDGGRIVGRVCAE